MLRTLLAAAALSMYLLTAGGASAAGSSAPAKPTSPAPPGATAAAKPAPPHKTRARATQHGKRSLATRALGLASLTPAQRTVVERLVAEEQAAAERVKAADGQIRIVLAKQVEQGKIDRAQLPLKQATDTRVSVRMKEVKIAERLHATLTPTQNVELGGGKDFLKPAPTPEEVKAAADRKGIRAQRMVDRLEKRVPAMRPEERTRTAERLRKPSH